MSAIASQITRLTIVYWTVYSDADQRKHQSCASLAFVWGIYRGDRWIPRTNGQQHGKCFHLMTSSWTLRSAHGHVTTPPPPPPPPPNPTHPPPSSPLPPIRSPRDLITHPCFQFQQRFSWTTIAVRAWISKNNRWITIGCDYLSMLWSGMNSLQWRHNGRDSVPNHQPHDCLHNRLFRRRSKKTSKLRVTGLCAGNSPGTGDFPAQMASYAENVSIWWRHHV